MLEQQPQRQTLSLPLKAIAISAAGLLLGFGLCGAGAVIGGHTVSQYFFISGSAVLAISAILMFVSFIALILSLIFSRPRN